MQVLSHEHLVASVEGDVVGGESGVQGHGEIPATTGEDWKRVDMAATSATSLLKVSSASSHMARAVYSDQT